MDGMTNATRTAYDAVAADYAELADADLTKPFNRAMVELFAELVTADGTGRVLDVGCGPGHVTERLRSLGVAAEGVDLSPGMVEQARVRRPDIPFRVGTMTALDIADEELAGLVAWYSIIHLEPDQRAGVFAEFHRVLRRNGRLLLAFQVGDEPLRLTEAFGLTFPPLVFHRLRPSAVVKSLERAGFAVTAVLDREADATERTPQAYVIARKRPA